MLSTLPCLLLYEAKRKEEVKDLISLQFIFIVSRCFNLLDLGGRFSLCFPVAQTPQWPSLTTSETPTSEMLQTRTAQPAALPLLRGCRRSTYWQQTGAGRCFTENNVEKLKWFPCSPLLVPQGWHLPCVCCTRSWKRCPQRTCSRMPTLIRGGCPCPPGHAMRRHSSRDRRLEARQVGDVALASWCRQGCAGKSPHT